MLKFPETINEKAARVVAGVVALSALVAVLTGWLWIVLPLAYGFWARVLAGPTLSPLARLASTAIAPRLGAPVTVPGPPKRFAQAMGAAMTTAAAGAWALGAGTVARVLLAMLVLAASLEAVFALCIGCMIFARLMRLGVIPAETCEQCSDIGAARA